MSNSAEVCVSQQQSLALGGGRLEVFVEGRVSSELEAVELCRAGYPDFSELRLRYNPAQLPEAERVEVEQIESVFAIGSHVTACQVFDGGVGVVRPERLVVFRGQIEEVRLELDGEREDVRLTARDISAVLGRVTVYGRRIAQCDDGVFLRGMDCVFNEAGLPNAAEQKIQRQGKSYTGFSAWSDGAKMWTAAEVLLYLLCEYAPADRLFVPSAQRLEALTAGEVVRDLDVTGLDLVTAVKRCCEQTGLEFRFEPRASVTGPGEAIVFYRPSSGRQVELNLQNRGQGLSISRTNIAFYRSERSYWPVTHRYIVEGDRKVFEATFELIGAWDPSLEDIDYEKFSPVTNNDFEQVRNIYRKWCLNEAGDYSGEPYNRGECYKFSSVFGTTDYVHRRRRFLPALSTDGEGTSLGYYLEVSYDNGEHWYRYADAFDVLLDECGVWLSSEQLGLEMWFAALKGVLKFRITASVVSDERVTSAVSDGPVESVADVVDRPVFLPRRYKYRRVSEHSIFYGGQADEADDSVAIRGFARRLAESNTPAIERIRVRTLLAGWDYRPGDRVTCAPEARDILGCRADGRSVFWIERARCDFVNQFTELEILRRRV